jgi:hypothetical protein
VLLCVYTSLHLNVPGQRPYTKPQLLKRILWFLCGTLVPEVLVHTAWSQFRSACKLSRIVEKHIEKQARENPDKERLEWSLTHSFFAQMGGLAFETGDVDEPEFVDKSPRAYITANGAASLAELGCLPNLPKKLIQDKSRADGFGVTVVALQLAWFIAEIIGRVAAGLPLTLLEIVTAAHVACALTAYVLWWHKPRDIREPIIVEGEWTRSLCAAMWMFSRVSSVKEYADVTRPCYPEIERMLHYEPARTVGEGGGVQSGPDHKSRAPRLCKPGVMKASTQDLALDVGSRGQYIEERDGGWYFGGVRQPASTRLLVELDSGQIVLPFGFSPRPSSLHFRTRTIPGGREGRSYTPPVRLLVDKHALQRWMLTLRSFDEHSEVWDRYRKLVETVQAHDGSTWAVWEYPWDLCQKKFVDPRIQNMPGEDLIKGGWLDDTRAFEAFCISVFGAIHAAAWNNTFPTAFEQWTWRVGTLCIFCSVGLWLDPLMQRLRAIAPNWPWSCLVSIFQACYYMIGASFALFYLLIRGFFLVEAVISFRALPLTMYQTPRWSQYLSHF